MNGSSSVKDQPGGRVEPVGEREAGMVERVARAIFAKIDPELLVNYDPEDERAPYVDGRVVHALARAALEAMRPFFAAELERAERGSFGVGEWWDGHDSGQVSAWEQAVDMIDAALSGEG